MWDTVLLLRDILLIVLEALAIVLCLVIIGSVIISIIDEIRWILKGTDSSFDNVNDKENKK